MTRAKLNQLLALQEEWAREAHKRGLNAEAIEKANQRVKQMMNEMLDNGFGPNIDKMHT